VRRRAARGWESISGGGRIGSGSGSGDGGVGWMGLPAEGGAAAVWTRRRGGPGGRGIG
jgi:hypothetical protein